MQSQHSLSLFLTSLFASSPVYLLLVPDSVPLVPHLLDIMSVKEVSFLVGEAPFKVTTLSLKLRIKVKFPMRLTEEITHT